MKTADYNFQWLDAVPINQWMKENNVEELRVQAFQGINFALCESTGFMILMATTVPGLCKDLQVTTVRNKHHKNHPGNYLMITWKPYTFIKKKCEESYSCDRMLKEVTGWSGRKKEVLAEIIAQYDEQ